MPIERATTVTQSFTGVGNGPELTVQGDGSAWLEGTFTGTFNLECRSPGMTGFVPVLADLMGTPLVLTAPGRIALDDPHEGVRYRWRCSVHGSGTCVAGLTQG